MVTEILYLLGAISVTALTVNYWNLLLSWVRPWSSLPVQLIAPIVFWALFLIVLVFAHMVLHRLTGLIRWERLHWLIQGIGMIVGTVRGLWWSGLILLALTMSGFAYLQESVQQRSVVGPRLALLSRTQIEWIADKFPGARFRGDVFIPPVATPSEKH